MGNPKNIFEKELTPEEAAERRAREDERSQLWLREHALESALQLHKNNGGMMTVQQLLVNTQTILEYLKGENK